MRNQGQPACRHSQVTENNKHIPMAELLHQYRAQVVESAEAHIRPVFIKDVSLGTYAMCGIVGYVGEKQVVPVILEGLRRLEYRGYDSAGIAVGGNGHGLEVRRAEGKLRNLELAVRRDPLHGT